MANEPPGWAWGIDISYDALTPEKAAALVADGVKVVGQCLWTGSEQPLQCNPNLHVAEDAGLIMVGYISVAPGHDGGWHVQQAFIHLDSGRWETLAKTPVDVELPGLDYQAHVIKALDAASAKGKPRDVYTNYNTWMYTLGNPPWPADTGQWDAGWDDNPYNAVLVYGGATPDQVFGMQYTGGEDVDGVYADRDVFRLSAFTPPPPQSYVTHLTQRFSDGNVWELDVVPPP